MMMKARRRILRTASLWLLLVCAALPRLAHGQAQYRSMAPQALIEVWEMAPQSDRPLIADALFENRTATLVTLRAALLTGTAERKLLACSMLAELRDTDSVPQLLTATADADEQVQGHAVSALRALGDRRAVTRLRELVAGAQSPSVLKRSVVALGKLGTATDASRLRPLLSHPDESVRVIAAGALAMLGSSEGQGILLAAMGGDDPAAQKNATFALGYLRTPEARQRLAEILGDPAGRWKSYAVMALAQQDRAVQTPPEQVASLERLAQGRDRLVAQWAVDELTDLAAPEATEAIRGLANRQGQVGQKARLRLKVREGR